MPIRRVNLDLTYKCNARCVHCSRNAGIHKKKELTVTQWKRVVNQCLGILPKKGFSIILQGGEPTISPAFFPVLKEIRKRYPGGRGPYCSAQDALFSKTENMISIATNGIILDSILDKLVELGIENLRISLDGANSRINNAIRPGTNFDRLKKNIENASKVLPVQVAFVVMNSNKNQIIPLIRLCSKMGVFSIRLTPFRPTGRGVNLFNELVSKKDYQKIVMEIKKELLNYKSPPLVSLGCPAPYAEYVIRNCKLSLINSVCKDVPLKIAIHRCYAFSDEITINPYGFVTGCCYMPLDNNFFIGNVKNKLLKTIINSLKFKEMMKKRTNNKINANCRKCANVYCNGECLVYSRNSFPFCKK